MLLPFIIIISLAVLEAWAADQIQYQDNSTSSTLGPTTTGNSQVRATSTHILDIQTAHPTDSFNLSSNYMAIGLEPAFLPLYNNNLSAFLFTMTPMRTLRLAGVSGDTLLYNSSQMEPVMCLSDPDYTKCPRESIFKLGPKYFDALTQHLKNTNISIQAPMAELHKVGELSLSPVPYFFTDARNKVGIDRIEAIALGIEPNLYQNNKTRYFKDAGLVIHEYHKVSKNGKPIWELRNAASSTFHENSTADSFIVEQILNEWKKSDMANELKYVNDDYDQFEGMSGDITQHLLSHTEMVTAFEKYKTNIKMTRERGLGYILNEKSGLYTASNETTSFAHTLWLANFLLYAISHGVTSVTVTQSPHSPRALWTPQEGLPMPGPRVLAPYHALSFFHHFMHNVYIGENFARILDTNSSKITAYARFRGNNPTHLAIVNLARYEGQGERQGVEVCIKNLDKNVTAKFARLHADAGIAAAGQDVNGKDITFAGRAPIARSVSGHTYGESKWEYVPVQDGVVKFVVADSEAIMVYFFSP